MKKYILFLALIFIPFGICIAQQPDKWNAAKSTHFIVYYKNAPPEFIEPLMGKAEEYYNRIADDLGFSRYNFWLWDNRAKIYIHDNSGDYQSATGQPSWSAGCALTRDKVITSFPYAKGFFETILPHEMGHIIFREFVGLNNNAIPLWLEEGVASYQEKDKYSTADRSVKEAMEQGNFISLDKLPLFDARSITDNKSVQLFYNEAFSIVNFLIKKCGKDNFMLFCQNLRDKKNLERAIASAYPFSNIRELDEAWQKYLRDG